MRIFDLTKCPYSNRNGSYGGAAGDKDGILIDGEEWIAKYPKATIGMHKNDKLSPFAQTPLSEYLGSHIYQILGYPVHETPGLLSRELMKSEICFRISPESIKAIRSFPKHAGRITSNLFLSDMKMCSSDGVSKLREFFDL